MYADDSSFFLSGPSPDALILSANTELTKVYQWLIQNKLSLNIKKSKYMFFYKSRLKYEVTSQLQINNHTIERVRQFKFLGYQLDEKLSWNSHISMISSKVAKNIGLLLKLRKVLDSNTLRNLYFSIIHPYFSNGLHVWGNTNITYLQQAIKLQKKAIRVINNSHPKEHTIPLFKKYNILPSTSQYELNTALFMFKIHHGQHPKAILVLFNRRFNESTRTTRQQQHFVVPKARCKIYEKSIFVQGPKKFNELVKFCNLNCSIHTYKKLLSHYFLNSLE